MVLLYRSRSYSRQKTVGIRPIRTPRGKERPDRHHQHTRRLDLVRLLKLFQSFPHLLTPALLLGLTNHPLVYAVVSQRFVVWIDLFCTARAFIRVEELWNECAM